MTGFLSASKPDDVVLEAGRNISVPSPSQPLQKIKIGRDDLINKKVKLIDQCLRHAKPKRVLSNDRELANGPHEDLFHFVEPKASRAGDQNKVAVVKQDGCLVSRV